VSNPCILHGDSDVFAVHRTPQKAGLLADPATRIDAFRLILS
jgi:hypothetical protein